MRLDDVDDSIADFGRHVEADDEVFVEFGQVSFLLPDVNIRANINEGLGGMADGLAALFKLENTFVDVVAVIHRNTFVCRFGTPNFRRNFNDKGIGRCVQSDRGRWNSIGDGIGGGGRTTWGQNRQIIDDWSRQIEQIRRLNLVAPT